jgi:hypothetical protein
MLFLCFWFAKVIDTVFLFLKVFCVLDKTLCLLMCFEGCFLFLV